MNRKTLGRLLGALIVIGVVLVAAVLIASLTLDFYAAQRTTSVQSSVGSSTSGENPPIRPDTLVLSVAGDSDLARAIETALVEPLGALGLGSVEVISTPTDQTDAGALLVVEVTIEDVQWNPLYGHAEVTVSFAYATVGDVSWRHEDPPVFHNEGSGEVQAQGDITLTDTAQGLLARRAYTRLLAESIAQRIIDDLNRLYATP